MLRNPHFLLSLIHGYFIQAIALLRIFTLDSYLWCQRCDGGHCVYAEESMSTVEVCLESTGNMF